MKKISTRIIISMILSCLTVVLIVSSILTINLLKQVNNNGNLVVQNEVLNLSTEFEEIFSQATYKANSIQQFAESVFNTQEYKINADIYMDNYIRPIMNKYVSTIIMDSYYIQGAYFSIDPDLYETNNIYEIYFADYGEGVVMADPADYEDYYEDNPDMDWFYIPYKSGKPYWTNPYEGEGVNMVSYVLPVIIDGETIGVAGVDLAISDITDMVQNANIYDTGFTLLQDNHGDFFDYNNIMNRFSSENIAQMNQTKDTMGLIKMDFSDENYTVGYSKLQNDYCFFVFAPQDEIGKEAKSMLILVIVVIILGLLASFVISLIIGRIISSPIISVSDAIEKLSDGDYSVRLPDSLLNKKDEIGRLAHAAKKLRLRLEYLTDQVVTISTGDLTNKIELAFEDDHIGIALNNTIDNLNDMIQNIEQMSNQLSVESEQVAIGSQSLAEGFSRQILSIEKLRNIMDEVSENNNTNVAMLDGAINIAEHIEKDAKAGGEHMTNLTLTVNDINDDSHKIYSVLKVIDDIAFQTNILALNAAVEAKRAGQHGQGFSVVAEEVRSLAAKSALAAKETTELVTISAQRAALGAQLAETTSQAFLKIVNGITKSNEIIAEIANAAKTQEDSVHLMNHEIDSVLDIVHNTTSASEESAASAEEMSQQSIMLKELIEHFKLK